MSSPSKAATRRRDNDDVVAPRGLLVVSSTISWTRHTGPMEAHMGMSSKDKLRKKRSLASTDGVRCALCLRSLPLDQLTLDHIHPRGAGGSNALWNLRLACYACNHGRHNRLPEAR